MNCPDTHNWDLLAVEALTQGEADPLLAHLRECPDCRALCEQARRAHLDRVRMYDQFDRGHDSLREQLMAALPAAPERSPADVLVRGWRHTGEFAMSIKHKIGGRALIGVVSAAACIALIVILIKFGSGPDAFAAAIQQFQQAKTIVCRLSTRAEVNGTTVRQSGKLYSSADYGSRVEILQGGTVVMTSYTPLSGPMTMVNPGFRQYTVVDAQAAGPSARGESSPDEFIRALTRMQGQASRELGRKELNGVQAVGYEISGQALGLGFGDQVRSELWIDADTLLPVRYVAEITGSSSGMQCEMVFDQFEWNTPLDAGVFTPDIPADYTRIEAKMPVPDEAALVKALGNYAGIVGKYPATLQVSTVVTEYATAIGRKTAETMVKGQKPMDQQTLMQRSVEIGAGLKYYGQLVNTGAQPEYFGQTVTPAQADAVLLRWKLTGNQWRVIYGDLRIETVEGN